MKSILYLEDDPIAIDLLKMLLANLYALDSTSNAEEALKMVKQKKYDALLIDINLGFGLNGIDVVQIIQEIPEYKDVPLIAITAYASNSEKKLFLSKGFSHYLSKPFYSRQLREVLENAINRVTNES